MDIGDVIRLKGKTLKGKNRINRGGDDWKIVAFHEDHGALLQSIKVGQREMFWLNSPDQNVQIV
jgi:hypothetical protein